MVWSDAVLFMAKAMIDTGESISVSNIMIVNNARVDGRDLVLPYRISPFDAPRLSPSASHSLDVITDWTHYY